MLREYKDRIRPIAISIIRKNDEILVYQRKDDITKEIFYRLIGGCIEFTEASDVALKREFKEEISAEIERDVLVCVAVYMGKVRLIDNISYSLSLIR